MVAAIQAQFNEAQQQQDTAVLGMLYRYGKDRPAKYRRLVEAFSVYSTEYRFLSDMPEEMAQVKAEAERRARAPPLASATGLACVPYRKTL